MLFNAPEFLFGFLPATLVIVFAAAHFFGRKIGTSVLIAASLFFYAWWKVPYLAIVVGSVLLNLGLARLIERNRKRSGKARLFLTAGIAANLLVLAYFKYANFLISTISGLTSLRFPALNIVLPIGLSFYTFQQISFLVDTATGRVGTITAREYAAAVLFFPHLIAGPLVNYRDIIWAPRKIALARARQIRLGASR